MITDSAEGRQHAIPGRLKALILNDRFSVAYAGHSDPAQNAIREAYKILQRDGHEIALEHLRQATIGGADIDFVTASHYGNAELRRIWQGRISDPLAQTVIGNAAIVEPVMERFAKERDQNAKGFWSAYIVAFTDDKISAGEGVGGLPIGLTAQPGNHHYAACTFWKRWKPIEFVRGQTTYEDERDLLTGDWTYHFDVIRPARSGVAVLAAIIRQAKIGYIYAPLLQDDPSRITLLAKELPWTRHQTTMLDALNRALNVKLEEQLAQRASTSDN